MPPLPITNKLNTEKTTVVHVAPAVENGSQELRRRASSETPPLANPDKILLALDLDQTLIHSCSDLSEPIRIYGGVPLKYDWYIRRASGKTADELPDELVPPPIIVKNAAECPPINPYAYPGMKYKERFVWQRPHLREFLNTVSEHFDIVVYTASTKRHADPIIDAVDPDRRIKHRFYRGHCDFKDGVDPATFPVGVFPPGVPLRGYRKYLHRLCSQRYPERVLLLDNSPISFEDIKENAIHIDDYFGNDPHDRKLLNVLPHLLSLKTASDVRHSILKGRSGDGAMKSGLSSFSYIPVDSPLVTPPQHVRKQIFKNHQHYQKQLGSRSATNSPADVNLITNTGSMAGRKTFQSIATAGEGGAGNGHSAAGSSAAGGSGSAHNGVGVSAGAAPGAPPPVETTLGAMSIGGGGGGHNHHRNSGSGRPRQSSLSSSNANGSNGGGGGGSHGYLSGSVGGGGGGQQLSRRRSGQPGGGGGGGGGGHPPQPHQQAPSQNYQHQMQLRRQYHQQQQQQQYHRMDLK